MDILELIGWFVFGFIMYQLIAAWIAMQHIKHIVKDVLEEKLEASTLKQKLVSIRFESVKQGEYSVVLVYNVETNKFLGQANTYAEAMDMLKKRYPSIEFVVAPEKDSQNTIQNIDTKPV